VNHNIPDREIPEFGKRDGAFGQRHAPTITIAIVCGLAIAHGASPAIAHILNTIAILIGTCLLIAALTWTLRVIPAGRYTPGERTRPRVGAR
jgi:hypothetical protein